MQVQVLVAVDVDSIELDDDKGKGSTSEFQEVAVEAVKNSVEFAEQNGFSHALAEVVCIGVVSVELVEVLDSRVRRHRHDFQGRKTTSQWRRGSCKGNGRKHQGSFGKGGECRGWISSLCAD